MLDNNEPSSSPVTAVLIVRGVGEDDADATVASLKHLLAEYKIGSAREANWSWTDSVQWPYRERPTATNQQRTTSIPRSEFLRSLGFSLLNTAEKGLSAKSKWSRILLPLVDALLWPARLLPAIFIAIPFLVSLRGFQSKQLTWLLISLPLPLIISLFSLDPSLVRSAFRNLSLRLFWPIAFPGFLAFSYLWVLPLCILITILASVSSMSLMPAAGSYPLFDPSGRQGFETSRWVAIVGAAGGLLGTAMAIGLASAIVRAVIPSLSFLFKVMADVVRYLGDREYRLRSQFELGTEIDHLSRSGADNLLILAHSLGTVIAIDYLRDKAPAGFRSIYLITAGSPLRRWLAPFFGCDYREPAELLNLVRGQLQHHGIRFEWLNVYRRKDPVGGRLGLPKGRDEVAVMNAETLFNAHLHYWTDSDVERIVVHFLRSQTTSST